jgi:hypothetical protein
MSIKLQTGERRRPKLRWLILSAALIFALLACAAAVVTIIIDRTNVPLIMGMSTLAGISLEVLLWTAAGVFGWGFLAKRREALGRWRRRLFGGGKNEAREP